MLKRALVAGVLLASASLGLAGCNGKKDSPAASTSASTSVRAAPSGSVGRSVPFSTSKKPPVVTKPHPLAERLCAGLHRVPGERIAGCCASSPQQYFYENCVAVTSKALEAQRISLDAAKVDQCAAAASSALQGCDWVKPGLPLPPAECLGVVVGKLGEGAACDSSLECSGKLHCAGAGPNRPGTCKGPQPNGGSCGTHLDNLIAYTMERDLGDRRPMCSEFCSPVANQCVPMPAVGDKCLSSVSCAPGQTCIGRTCQAEPPGGVGAACPAKPCAPGLRCSDGKCQLRAEPGQPCKTSFDCRIGGCVKGASGASTCGMQCAAPVGLPQASASAVQPSRRPR
jgi:hypothetical protein